MAFPIQQAVIDFHKKYGHPVRDTPETITEGEAELAYDFIAEELDELRTGLFTKEYRTCGEDYPCCDWDEDVYSPNLVEVADALGDVVFTAYGMAARHGIDLDRVLAAICESNMTKEANGLGKIKKGADYQPPRIRLALGLPE